MFSVEFTSSNFVLLRPLSPECRRWLHENVQPDAMWWGGALVVEHHYLDALVAGLQAAGFTAHPPTRGK